MYGKNGFIFVLSSSKEIPALAKTYGEIAWPRVG